MSGSAPFWNAATLPNASISTVGSTDEQPQQPSPVVPQVFADDALGRTSKALTTDPPSIQQLQTECMNLMTEDLSILHKDRVLKLSSVFTYEESLTRLKAEHGDDSLSYAALKKRVRKAKVAVAASRGVPVGQVKDELENNQKLSGAQDRQRNMIGARVTATSDRKNSRAVDNDPGTNEFIVDGKNVGYGPIARKRKATEERRQEARVVSSGAQEDTSSVEDPASEDERGEDVGVDGDRLDDDDELHPDFEEDGADVFPVQSTGSGAARQARQRPIEPFDPTPYGQPYAGTSLYVPGFGTEGNVSWEEWLEQHPYPYEVYWE